MKDKPPSGGAAPFLSAHRLHDRTGKGYLKESALSSLLNERRCCQ